VPGNAQRLFTLSTSKKINTKKRSSPFLTPFLHTPQSGINPEFIHMEDGMDLVSVLVVFFFFFFTHLKGTFSTFIFFDLNKWKVEKDIEWKEVKTIGKSPGKRRAHSAVVKDDVMYIVGGAYDAGIIAPSHIIFSFHFPSRTWRRIDCGPGPSLRYRFRTFFSHCGLVVMGGWNRKEHFSDMWEFVFGEGWRKVNIDVEDGVGCAQYSVITWENSAIFFGGHDSRGKKASDVLWILGLGHPSVRRIGE